MVVSYYHTDVGIEPESFGIAVSASKYQIILVLVLLVLCFLLLLFVFLRVNSVAQAGLDSQFSYLSLLKLRFISINL